jgi:hypothetical protein
MSEEEKDIPQDQGLSKGSRVFFVLLFALTFLSIGVTFYRYMIQKDFVIFTEEGEVTSPEDLL